MLQQGRLQHGRVVIGVSGASGAPYAKRVIELLAASDVEVHLALSALGRRLIADELGMKRIDLDELSGGRADRVTLYPDGDVGATIASGSFLHDGMIIVPGSSNTLASIAAGLTSNLLQRAATVTLKENRPLVLAYRESPISKIDLKNMVTFSEAGGIIAPLSPGFYMMPTMASDLVDFMAARLLDLIGAPHDLELRWSGS